ncbi:MAG: short-chain fatty acyl-CoA regulator family protein [bacterium]|nr:DUF2083 domain-containing protein [Myxococcales bacterium]
MTDPTRLGTKVRALRRREKLTQAAFAERLGISPSYLALIEGGRRPLTAPLLIKLASAFEVDLAGFAAEDDARVTADLLDAFADPVFDPHALHAADVREMVAAAPDVARAVSTMHRQWRAAQEQTRALAEAFALVAETRVELPRLRLVEPHETAEDDDDATDDGAARLALSSALPAEEVSDALQRADNHFPALEAAAERLRAELDGGESDLCGALVRRLEAAGVGVSVEPFDAMAGALRRFDSGPRRLRLSERLPRASLTFQLAHQAGLLLAADALDAIVADAGFASATARTLYRVALANYFAGAVLMPYDATLDAAIARRYDVELLMHRFGASFEQVAHRLTTLRRPHAAGVPLHFIRVDIAGNISKRFSGSGIRFARIAGACPRWNVHAAFLTPGRIRTQVSEMPDKRRYFCIARTVERGGAGWSAPRTTLAVGLGARLEDAGALVYAEGVDLERAAAAAVPVGITCRLCPRMDCAQRAMPPLHAPLRVDPDVRGLSFYATPGAEPAR